MAKVELSLERIGRVLSIGLAPDGDTHGQPVH